MTSRALAIRCLAAQAQQREPVDQVLATLLAEQPVADHRDRQLAMALIFGVLRHRQELDAILTGFSKTALHKLKPVVLQGLRIGLYQLLFMDRVPVSAAVNETILGLGRQPKWVKGFVNGVLRTISRDLDSVRQRLATLPPRQRLNHPDWLIDMWQQQFGEDETTRICLANNKQPPLSLYIHDECGTRSDYLDCLQAADIAAHPGRYGQRTVIVDDLQRGIDTLPGYAEGSFHIQDEAAQLIACFFADCPPGAYVDGCAGVGGKTLLLDETLPKEASLAAIEPHDGRSKLFRDNITRCKCRPIAVHNTTLQAFAHDQAGHFHGILLDAPCSGLGVIRRQPDIRWNRQPSDLKRLAADQLALLEAAAPLVAPGGFVVYATCSLAALENEEVIGSFLGRQPHFFIDPPHITSPAHELINQDGFLRTLPSQGLDGFFAVRLRRQGS